MCECGCASSDTKYRLSGPKGTLYIVTLSAECTSCDAPSGICIEQIGRGNLLFSEYRDDEFCTPLKLEDWPDSRGVAIVTGLRKHEFVEAVAKHLVGVSSIELGERGLIDQIGAEVIAEEMYADAQKRPAVTVPSRGSRWAG